ncbi:MAG: glycosyltransferase family 4 protein [Desulfomonilaceae bacterium]
MPNISDTFRRLYQLIPGSIRQRLDSYRLRRRVGTVAKKLTLESGSRVIITGSNSGLNVIGFLSAGLGLGEAARSTIRAANAVRLPVHTHEIFLRTHSVDNSVSFSDFEDHTFDVSVFHLNPDRLISLLDPEIMSCYLSSAYNIGFWFWETNNLPDYWVTASELFDEIWVGSSFCKSVMESKISKPVTRIPLNVAPVDPEPNVGRKELGLPEQGFLFITMIDFFSRPERKNPFGVIEAFQRAFGPDDKKVFLVVKTMGQGRNGLSKRLIDACRKDPRIIVVDKFLDRPQLYSLIKSSDCLVSLHRAEGFGLPIAEAMALGKPVVATGWSANMDFMNANNSFPVAYDMVMLDHYATPYPKGTVWANPKVEDTAAIMRKLAYNPELCRQVGDKGRCDIQDNFSPDTTGVKIVERLQQIREKL